MRIRISIFRTSALALALEMNQFQSKSIQIKMQMWQDIESVLLDASGAEATPHHPHLHYPQFHPAELHPVAYDVTVKNEPMDGQQPHYAGQWQASYHPPPPPPPPPPPTPLPPSPPPSPSSPTKHFPHRQ